MGRVENIFRLRWQISRDTGVAFASGLAVIALSTLLLPFRGTAWEGAAFFILRDLAMDFGFGFVLPVAYTLFVEGHPLAELGLTTRCWVANLAVNTVLAALLAFQFASQTPPQARLTLTSATAGAVFYILVAGIFEMLFFYGFLQLRFERALGVMPGIILAAAFYSLHHIGFQIPLEESPTGALTKLFFVGVMYMSVFRITKSLFIVYPFFWGVGACYDVLVTVSAPPEALRWWSALLVVVLMATSSVVLRCRWKART